MLSNIYFETNTDNVINQYHHMQNVDSKYSIYNKKSVLHYVAHLTGIPPACCCTLHNFLSQGTAVSGAVLYFVNYMHTCQSI